MDECDVMATAILNDEAKFSGVSGPFTDKLSEVFRKLRGLNFSWAQILALIQEILKLLRTGSGDWLALLQTIVDLFVNPTPPPAPTPTPVLP